MALSSAMFATDHQLVEGDWGETVVLNGATIAAVIGDLDDSDALGIPGVNERQRVSVTIRNSLLSRPVVVGDSITVRGEAMRILTVRDSGDGVSKEYECGSDVE